MLLRKTFRFEASHILPKHPGKCSRLHGHSWVLHVFVTGQIDKETGFVLDYGIISDWVKPVIDNLDHHHLGATSRVDEWGANAALYNSVDGMADGFYPSSENLLVWIGRELAHWPWWKLALEETCTSYAELTREEFDATHSHGR